uniref:HNH endonuclease signature motif containing protein n=1 Tax=Cellulosimicrobium cellulans TaxID=1710 RepID=UPI00130E9D5B
QAAHAVEDAVLPDAAQCSRRQLEQRVAREVRIADPQGEAGRNTRARCTRRVTRPRRRPHGMAAMWVVLAAEDATRVDGVLHHAARTAKALGDPRTLDQLRADGFRDLVVGDVPESDGPAFEVHLDPPAPVPTRRRASRRWPETTTRGAPTRPAEPIPTATLTPVSDPEASTAPTESVPIAPTPSEMAPGETAPTPPPASTEPAPGAAPAAPVPAAPASDLATAAARRSCTRCAGRPGAEVNLTIAASTLLGLDDHPADLDGYGPIDAVRARALADGGTWRRIITDPLTGQVLDVGRQRYRPPAALDEFVRTRDTTCAAPGCTVPARSADLDHTIEYHRRPGDPPDTPLGRTDADNLGPLCHRHHRLKTDGGFRLRQIQPGLFEWITPTGHRYLTRPGTGRNHDATTDPYDAPPPF